MTTAAQQLAKLLKENLGQVVFGMGQVIHGLSIALVTEGHVLLEGVPGLGKTLLAKTLAAQMGGRFKRVQCTADMMPSDLTGIHVYHQDKKEFAFLPGPLFADVVLVDEINRTGPKTQSALLQAMEEGAVTIDRDTHALPEGFFVIASQNPHDFEGTYPLPESQLDRFLLRLELTYPTADMEQQVLRTYNRPGGGHESVKNEMAQVTKEMIRSAQACVEQVYVSDAIYDYVQRVAQATRSHPRINLGLSLRGSLALVRCARTHAALLGQQYITPDDVKAVAHPVICHRLILTPDATLEGVGPAEILEAVLAEVEVPRNVPQQS
ncbi:MAG: MoxR family ATPase [Gammaproteobacteria bacterium]|nr:MoxR family ATPase [Gammaproteobacteria bacterium]